MALLKWDPKIVSLHCLLYTFFFSSRNYFDQREQKCPSRLWMLADTTALESAILHELYVQAK